jgi:hypothetical protein
MFDENYHWAQAFKGFIVALALSLVIILFLGGAETLLWWL